MNGWRRRADAPTGDVLSQDTIALLAEATRERAERLADLPLSRLLLWRYHASMQRLCGTEIFADHARRPAVRHAILEIERQIGELADCLRSGHSLYTSPEGRLSPDGRLSPIPGGLARLLEVAPEDTRVQPIAIVYDFIHTGRARAFVDVASPSKTAHSFRRKSLPSGCGRHGWERCASPAHSWPQASSSPRRRSQTQAGRSTNSPMMWAHGHAISHKADDMLIPGCFSHEAYLSEWQAMCATLLRRKLVRRVARNRWQFATQLLPIQVAPGDVGYKYDQLTYAWNELQDMLSLPSAVAPEQVHAAASELGEESL